MARYFLHMYANLKILFAQISILNRLLAYIEKKESIFTDILNKNKFCMFPNT